MSEDKTAAVDLSNIMSLIGADAGLEETRSRAVRQDSFDELLRQYQPYVARLVYRLTGWQETDIDDLVQEIFLKVYRNLHRFQGRSHIKTWLTRIVVNTCRSRHRRRCLRRKLWHASLDAETLPSKHGCPSEVLIEQENVIRIHRMMQRLPVTLREVTILRYLEDMTVDDIADVLGITANTVHVRLNRARKRMQEILSNSIQGEKT